MNEIHKCPAVRVGMFPKHTNATGTNIFGGVILSHMDIAGAIAAGEVTDHRVFTVKFDKVVFKQPVHIGDVLTCWSEVTQIGRTSITTRIVVEAQRKGIFIPVTEGEAVYVAVGDDGRPTPVSPTAIPASASVHSCDAGCHHPSAAQPKQPTASAPRITSSPVSAVDAQKCPAVRIGMMPRDTSVSGTNIFAGVILSHMDTAGVIATRDVTKKRVVTVSFDKVVFKEPVHVGDVLTCWSEVIKVGRTSITTKIVVQAQRKGVFIPVTEGEAVYVCVDVDGKPTPVADGDTVAVPTPKCGPSCGPHDVSENGSQSQTHEQAEDSSTAKRKDKKRSGKKGQQSNKERKGSDKDRKRSKKNRKDSKKRRSKP